MKKDETPEYALLALPHLVRAAQRHETMTYGELGAKIGVHHRQVSWVAGYIRDSILAPRRLPLLNCLIVNVQSKKPGYYYLANPLKAKSATEERREFEKLRDEVYAYRRWNDLLKELNLSPLPGEGN